MNTAQVLRDEPLSVDAHLDAPDAQSAAPSGKEGGYSIQSIQGVAGVQDGVSIAVLKDWIRSSYSEVSQYLEENAGTRHGSGSAELMP